MLALGWFIQPSSGQSLASRDSSPPDRLEAENKAIKLTAMGAGRNPEPLIFT
jgi:hypothetical protein